MKKYNFKPIYYLGAKSRFLADINSAIDDISPKGGRVCDLFSGSGVVGGYLSKTRPVTAVDIQEYSRILSSAILNPAGMNSKYIEEIISNIKHSELLNEIIECVTPMLEIEENYISQANIGRPDSLVHLLESPPLTVWNKDSAIVDSSLNEAKEKSIRSLMNKGLLTNPNTTVLRYFGGIYFSFYQSIILDMILHESEKYDGEVRDTLKAVALSTASSLVNTVGKQFAQPLRPRNKDGSIKSNITSLVNRDRTIDPLQSCTDWLHRYSSLPLTDGNSIALRMDYKDAITEYGDELSVIYADPPYTRDHYSRFYHVLETMSLRDNPSISTSIKGGKIEWSRGIYRENRHQSPFCIRSSAPSAFEDLFKKSSDYNIPLVLSYSPHEDGDGTHPRVVSTNKIIEIANAFYKKVSFISIDGIAHNQLNRRDLNLKKRACAEVILKCSF
ncbi:DNA adenine methylase [Serratia sp. root2]|uniref:DNA adenine methylase n=1 Tax=Serratia sp. root2 TaxID=3059676 RepID=UPI002892247A|nr:DNA adenine methylase [Serratia sp. root2]MDT3252277.1 DNA adenine methylase [Serratia sp. root2]